MIKKIIEHKMLKVILELIILGIFAWTFTQVRDIPGTYITRVEAGQNIKELKIDINETLDPIRQQVQQIYNHLLGGK